MGCDIHVYVECRADADTANAREARRAERAQQRFLQLCAQARQEGATPPEFSLELGDDFEDPELYAQSRVTSLRMFAAAALWQSVQMEANVSLEEELAYIESRSEADPAATTTATTATTTTTTTATCEHEGAQTSPWPIDVRQAVVLHRRRARLKSTWTYAGASVLECCTDYGSEDVCFRKPWSIDHPALIWPGRSYSWFGILSNVRRDAADCGPICPRMSRTFLASQNPSTFVAKELEVWDCDGHSFGMITAEDFLAWRGWRGDVRDTFASQYEAVERAVEYFVGAEHPERLRVLFFYDN